jgi:DNA mismatch repair protein MSH6
MVEQDKSMCEEADADPTQETITFLYRNEPGPCPKSYGFNAARLAGMPDGIVLSGHRRAVGFERCGLDETVFVSAEQRAEFCEMFSALAC